MAATKPDAAASALMSAALALPILAVPARAGAAEVGAIGVSILRYQERGLMRVTEPVAWGHARFAEVWEVQASAAVDIVTGASPQLVSNISGKPVQTITGASVDDRRKTGDVKVSRRVGEATLGASYLVSKEEDYRSKAFGIEARLDLDQRNTTLTAAYGRSRDRVGSSDNPALDEPRDTHEYLIGITQVLTQTSAVQSTLTHARGRGWYNDPYKSTFSVVPGGGFVVSADLRPDSRDTLAWLTRYRRHFPAAGATLQADYRFYRDDWDIRAHTLEVAWHQRVDERWAVRPALRYYTQSKASFYSPVVPVPQPALQSSDQRLAAFGGLSPSLRVIVTGDTGWSVEATAGYIHNAKALRAGGGGSEAFETLRAWYGILSVSHSF